MTPIDRSSPDETRPYLHLVPVLELLRKHGNRTVGSGFLPTQGGWECHFRDPLDFDLIERELMLPDTISLSRDEGSLFDRLSWSVVQGPAPGTPRG